MNKNFLFFHLRTFVFATLFVGFGTAVQSQTTLGGVDMGNLTDYLLVFTDGSVDANWQGASKGFIGDVAVDGIQADERTSGGVAYAGTIYTNDGTLDAWASIVDRNDPPQVSPAQAFGATGETTRIADLEADLANAFAQIDALYPTAGYTGVSSTSLNGLNTQNSISEVYVINVTSGFGVSSKINITGDAGDIFFLRWDTDANPGNGYQGDVKFQSGGAIVPLGGLKPTNFIHVAGNIKSSGGGSNPPAPYPQGPRTNDGTGNLIAGASNFSGGGFFTGYWLTTGDPSNGETSSMSNAIFVGGWYSSTTKFSMTSGTSGVYVSPPQEDCPFDGLTATPGACNTANNQYTLTGTLTFATVPAVGFIRIEVLGGGSQIFNAPFSDPLNYSISGLSSDGATHLVFASYGSKGACVEANYTAPARCRFNKGGGASERSDAAQPANASGVIQELTTSPNPFDDHVLVQFFLADPTDAQLEVYDLSGRTVYTLNLGNRTEGDQMEAIETNDWRPGCYLLALRDANGGRAVRKLVKF